MLQLKYRKNNRDTKKTEKYEVGQQIFKIWIEAEPPTSGVMRVAPMHLALWFHACK